MTSFTFQDRVKRDVDRLYDRFSINFSQAYATEETKKTVQEWVYQELIQVAVPKEVPTDHSKVRKEYDELINRLSWRVITHDNTITDPDCTGLWLMVVQEHMGNLILQRLGMIPVSESDAESDTEELGDLSELDTPEEYYQTNEKLDLEPVSPEQKLPTVVEEQDEVVVAQEPEMLPLPELELSAPESHP